MQTGFRKVFVLALFNSLAYSATALLMLVGSLVGVELAPSAAYATLPITLMIVGIATGIVPVTQLMKRLGRKRALWFFMLVSASACLLAAYSLLLQSFGLFCVSAALIGMSNAALQQIRFIAMECVKPESSSTAASIIMSSGIIAALLGPELAVIGRNLTDVAYQGSFILMIGCIVIASIILFFFTPAAQKTSDHTAAPRSAAVLFKNPDFILALASSIVAFVIMTFVMTGTPISMHHHFSHSLSDTKWVIQSHMAAMFLPSFITPWLFKLFGIRGMMTAGLLCYGLTITGGWLDTSVNGFWFQLVTLGIGWNFLFIAGTSLLPSTYAKEDKFKAQAINDSAVFSSQAIASLAAGWAINLFSWTSILSACLVPMAIMALLLLRSTLSKKR